MQQIPDYSQILKLAQSPAGRNLIRHFRETGGESLQRAVAQGDTQQLAQLLKSLSAQPDTAALIKALEEML